MPALGHNDQIFAENLKDLYLQKAAIVVYVVNKVSFTYLLFLRDGIL